MTGARHTLRAPPLDFTGRKKDLDELLGMMGPGGMTISALQGQGGIGKTALALKVAEALKPRYPDAQIDLDLKGADVVSLSPSAVMAQVIHAFEPTTRLPEGEAELGGIYRSVLHDKRAILLFDNARDRAQVEPLVPPSGCVMIVTSRRSFVLSGLVARNLDELDPADAIALVRRIAPRLTLGEAAEIAGLCGRLPLALRLAGSALAEQADLEPGEYIEQLKDAQERLGLVEGSLSLSFALLDQRLQAFWACLGVLVGDFDRDAAGAVGELEPAACRRALGELVKHSMVHYDGETKRYRLHDLARLFAISRLGEVEEYGAKRRHAEHFMGVMVLADELYLKGGASIMAGLALYDREWANIYAGQAWAAARAAADDAAAALCSEYPDRGWYCSDLRQQPRDKIRWCEAGLAAARRLGRRQLEGVHLCSLGLVYDLLGEPSRANQLFEQALTVSREIGDRRTEGETLGCLGVAYAMLGESRRAIELCEEALAITRETRNRLGEGWALYNLGLAYANLGELRRAIELVDLSLTITREIGNRPGEGGALGNLGHIYAKLGEPRRAIELYEQQLVIARELGDRQGEALASWNVGLSYQGVGELDKAIASLQVYVDFQRSTGHSGAEAHAAYVDALRARQKG